MGANKYENFTIEKVPREKVLEAYYNPRKIDDSARDKLKKFLKSKEGGLWCPLTWNKRTGHQRLAVLDALHRGKPYNLSMAVVDVDEQMEVKGNIFMNNPSAMGEWDVDKLHEIHELFPEIDFLTDLGFEQDELEVYGFQDDGLFDDADVDGASSGDEPSAEDYREVKREAREKAKQENQDGDGKQFSAADFTLTFIFPDAKSKQDFLTMIGRPVTESRLNSQILLDLAIKN